MPTIDELQIEISTKAKNVDDSIDILVKKLDKLSSSLKGINSIPTKNLGKISSNFNNLSKSSVSMANGLNRVSASATKSTKKFNGLASSIGKFYATWFMAIRGVKGLWKSIESTADYIEAYNYFNVALGKIGSDWSHQFEKYGYANAQAYADSFSERLQQKLGRLSGVAISTDASGNGLLTSTGVKNLGLNIQEITQYASQLASVTNSVGQVGEVSLATANAFTKLGADISSLFNLDYSQVMGNLQSGLIGQSRALYKYGIDITNATLQTYAYKLGLSKAVSEMTQAEKMQLRMIAILDQSRVSWGDLANTINSPSNMIRQLSNNMKELGMVLGQLFIPLLKNAIPVLNGLTIALKELITNIAGFLGVKIDLSEFGQGFSQLEEESEGIADGFDDATQSAKKLRNQLQGFDKLNLLKTSNNSGAGVGGAIDLTEQILKATEEYEKVWNAAYEKMENRAQEFANKIGKIIAPVGDIFKKLFTGDFAGAGADVSNLVVAFNTWLANAIDRVDWQKLGESIGDFVTNLNWTEILSSFGKVFWEAMNGAIEMWKGSFESAPIETTILTGILGIPVLGKISSTIGGAFSGIAGVLGGSSLFANISEMFSLWAGGAGTLGESFYAVFGAGGVIALALTALGVGLGTVYSKNEEIRQSFQNSISTIGEGFTPILTTITDIILPDLQNGWNEFLNILKPLGDFLNETFVSIWQDMINPALEYLGSDVLPMLNSALEKTWKDVIVPFGEFIGKVLNPIIEVLSWALGLLWKDVIVPLAKAIGNILGKAFEGLVDIWNEVVVPGLNAIITIFTWLWDNVLEPLGRYIAEEWGPVFEDVFEMIGDVIDGLSKALGGVIDFITGAFTGDWKKAWNGVADIFKGIFNGIGGIIEGVINFVIKGINSFIKGFDGLVSGFGDIIGIDISIPKLKEIDIPEYRTGGFPEDGLFFANHNELIGQFSNGQTAVANNEQIVAGIERGVEKAVTKVLAPYLADIADSSRRTANKDFSIGSRDVFNAVRTESSSYTRRTGQPAFI